MSQLRRDVVNDPFYGDSVGKASITPIIVVFSFSTIPLFQYNGFQRTQGPTDRVFDVIAYTKKCVLYIGTHSLSLSSPLINPSHHHLLIVLL
jgi:hypothetical protein